MHLHASQMANNKTAAIFCCLPQPEYLLHRLTALVLFAVLAQEPTLAQAKVRDDRKGGAPNIVLILADDK